jgi:hypothetical protein
MTKFLLPLLLVGAAAPAFAQTSERPLSFERDGVRYTATVKTVGTTTLITGHEVDSGRSFDLRAKNGRVSGTYGTTSVNYTVGR